MLSPLVIFYANFPVERSAGARKMPNHQPRPGAMEARRPGARVENFLGLETAAQAPYAILISLR